jgi:toxin YoeB
LPDVELRFSSDAWEDYQYWFANDRNIFRRLNLVIKDIRRSPFEGIGKPEPLKENLSGWWSRRITDEHRVVYRVVGPEGNQAVELASCRYHYG